MSIVDRADDSPRTIFDGKVCWRCLMAGTIFAGGLALPSSGLASCVVAVDGTLVPTVGTPLGCVNSGTGTAGTNAGAPGTGTAGTGTAGTNAGTVGTGTAGTNAGTPGTGIAGTNAGTPGTGIAGTNAGTAGTGNPLTNGGNVNNTGAANFPLAAAFSGSIARSAALTASSSQTDWRSLA
jgi:hypothetical protein